MARRFYKRTANKVEWLLLDLAGHPMYEEMHSIFISSVDHTIEPTIFVIVYDHDTLNAADDKTDDEHVCHWIESILKSTRLRPNETLRIKLVGLTSDLLAACDTDKQRRVLDMSKRAIAAYTALLLSAKQTNTQDGENDDAATPKTAEEYSDERKLDTLLEYERCVQLDEDVMLIDRELNKRSVGMIVSQLEHMTRSIDARAPLDQRNLVRDHIATLRVKHIDMKKLAESFDHNQLIQQHKWNTQALVRYAKAIGECFYMPVASTFRFMTDDEENDDDKDQDGEDGIDTITCGDNRGNLVFTSLEHVLNCFRMLFRHDLSTHLDYALFSTLGIFANEFEFDACLKRYVEHGVLEPKIMSCVFFDTLDMRKPCVALLKSFSLCYESLTTHVDDDKPCAFYRLILPALTTVLYASAESKHTGPFAPYQ